MADNTIQLKRSSVAGKTPNTSTLSTGELAINLTDKKLYSSDGSNIFEPAGNVSNINITGNATIKAVIANGGIGTAGQVLTSGGTGANVYWSTPSGGGGGGSVNADAQYTWTNTQTFSNTITFNSTINGTANNALYLDGTAASGYQTTAGLSANVATLAANSATYLGGNTAANLNTYADNKAANAYSNAIAYSGNAALAYANAVSYVDGKSYVNTTQLSSNLSNYAALAGAAFTGNVSITGNLIVTGTTVTVNTATLDVKDINITVAKGVATAALADGAGLTVDTANIGWYYHNASNTWQSNVGITPSANATYNLGSATLQWANVYAKAIYANGSVGTAGQVLASNGSAIYWTADQGSNAITSNTLTSNYISVSTGTLTVGNSTVNTDIGNNYVSVGNLTGYVNVYSSYIYLGNTSANATINSTTYTGSANNASYLGGVAAASYVNTSGNYTLSGNVTFSANLIVGSTGDLIINATAGVWANGTFGANGNILTSNGSAVYWSTGLTASSLTANSVAITTGTITVGNSTVNTDIGNNYISVGNNSGYANIYSGYIFLGNTVSNATINSTTYTGTANNALYLGGVAAASYVNTSGNYTLSGNTTFSANLIIGATGDLIINAAAGFWANGGFGTAGQVLTSNGSAVYWATAAGGAGVNLASSYAFTNTTASGNATSGAITTAGGLGVANNIYAGGRIGFSNSTNISVAYMQYNPTTGSVDMVFG